MSTSPQRPEPSRRFSVAPMMDWTDRHCRYFLRQFSSQALLYTEMVTTGALLHNDAARFLRYDECEHPLALQLGGSNPADLAACARMAEEHGYDEVNLNVGCPSDRVQNNMIGACLMGHPQLVADCVKAMQDQVQIPVTVKHRIGINGRDSYAELCDFVGTVPRRPVAQGEPRGTAAALRGSRAAQAGLPGAGDRPQRRHQDP